MTMILFSVCRPPRNDVRVALGMGGAANDRHDRGTQLGGQGPHGRGARRGDSDFLFPRLATFLAPDGLLVDFP